MRAEQGQRKSTSLGAQTNFRLLQHRTLMPLVRASAGQKLKCLGPVLVALMLPDRVRETAVARLEADSLLVEAEAVGNRGCLTAAGDPELGQDP